MSPQKRQGKSNRDEMRGLFYVTLLSRDLPSKSHFALVTANCDLTGSKENR